MQSWLAFMAAYFLLVIWQEIAFPERTFKGYFRRFQRKVAFMVNGSSEPTIRFFFVDLAVFVALLYVYWS